MARPLRLEFEGAIYHVTARGDRREPIFQDDSDRKMLLAIMGQALERFEAVLCAYCLMENHYHFVLRTHQPNLSRLMRHINGVYTQAFNRRHAQVGHLFQGRFKALLVDKDAYLLEVCRYVDLNPVRAGIVKQPGDWVWSSYRAHTEQAGAGLARQLSVAPTVVPGVGAWVTVLCTVRCRRARREVVGRGVEGSNLSWGRSIRAQDAEVRRVVT